MQVALYPCMNTVSALSKTFAASTVIAAQSTKSAQKSSPVDTFARTSARASAVTNLPPPSAPKQQLTPALSAAAESFATNLGLVEDCDSADSLTLAFLKLNLTDANESVQMHQELVEVQSQLRQMAIDEAQQANRNASELQKELEKAANFAATLSNVFLALQIAAHAAQIATGAPVAVIMTGVSQLAMAPANLNIALKQADIHETKNIANRHNVMADEAQQALSNEADLVNSLMTHKNDTVDTVFQMINARWEAKQAVFAAYAA